VREYPEKSLDTVVPQCSNGMTDAYRELEGPTL
jgi:hypothetical protein